MLSTARSATVASALARALAEIEGSDPLDASKVTVVLVLGGPGVGKGTQCARLVREYGFEHISAGDLLRSEQTRAGSVYGPLIADCITNGQIVPQQVTIALLRAAIERCLDAPRRDGRAGWGAGRGRFLIDGFPRKLDQGRTFDACVVDPAFVLYLSAGEDVMLRRLLERGKTSGRADDNLASIRKRFRTFERESVPVMEHYRAQGKVVEVDAARDPGAVYADIRAAMDRHFAPTDGADGLHERRPAA